MTTVGQSPSDGSDGPDEREPSGGAVGRRIRSLVIVGSRDLFRDPVLLLLLAVVPLYFVGVWGAIVPDSDVPIEVATGEGTASVTVGFPALITAIVAPVTVALLVGITALFLVQRSLAVDERLRITGYRSTELFGARLLVLAGLACVVATLVTGAAHLYLSPVHLGWFVLGLVLAGGSYGAVGAIAGRVLGRMGGVYVLLFVPLLDIMLLQNPLGEDRWWIEWLPGHHPTELVLSAAFAESIAIGHFLSAVVAVAVLSVSAAVVVGMD